MDGPGPCPWILASLASAPPELHAGAKAAPKLPQAPAQALRRYSRYSAALSPRVQRQRAEAACKACGNASPSNLKLFDLEGNESSLHKLKRLCELSER